MRALVVGLIALLPLGGRAAPMTNEQRRELVDRLLFGPIDQPPLDDPLRVPDRAWARIRAGRAADALEHLKLLLAVAPDDAAELHWLSGVAWGMRANEFGAERAPTELVQRAVDELETAQRLSPDGPRAEALAAQLAIEYSKLGRFEPALAQYDRAIRLHGALSVDPAEDAELGRLQANAAETLMALGRLDESIARYRASVDHARNDPDGRVLAWWGLGVALDRDEQLEKSREAIRQALLHDRPDAPLAGALHKDDVFFMPLGDKFYYVALGFLSRENPRAAADAFRAFLTAQPRSRWAPRARAHLDEIAKATAARPSVNRFRVNVAVLEGSADRDAHREAETAGARLAACFDAPPGRTGEVLLDLYD